MIQKAYSKTGDACRVTFKIPAGQADAESGAVLGEFNQWHPEAHPFARLEDGSLSVTLSLPVGGQYRFRYLFDGGRWENDVAADAYVPNRFGTEDSVLLLPPPTPAPAKTTEKSTEKAAKPRTAVRTPVKAKPARSTAKAKEAENSGAAASKPTARRGTGAGKPASQGTRPSAPTRRRKEEPKTE